MVTVVFETPWAAREYSVVAGLESILGGERRVSPQRAVGARSWLAVGDGASAVRQASLTLTLRRTDPLDHSALTDLATHLEATMGLTIRVDGEDVFHAQVVKAEWTITDRRAYPWISMTVSLWLGNPSYVSGSALLANDAPSEVIANGMQVYVNGSILLANDAPSEVLANGMPVYVNGVQL